MERTCVSGLIGVTRSRVPAVIPSPVAPLTSGTNSAPPAFRPVPTPQHEGFAVEDPAKALEKYLPELRDKADLVVVLDYETRDAAKNLMQKVKVTSATQVVVAGEWTGMFGDVPEVNGAQVVSAGFEGRQVGNMLIEFQNDKPMKGVNRIVEVLQSIPTVPAVTKLVEEAKKAVISPTAANTPAF